MSKLIKIRLENFMSLPLAEFDFDGTNIISPCGYNDSGKSAVTRALEVLWYDSYSQMQSKFITDGRNYFKISNFFDDGIEISREKFLSGASHWVLLQHTPSGVKSLYDNKLPSGAYAASRGVPEPIQAYLGIYQDEVTGEELNIRRNTNKLLLVATTGGENYKFINALAQGEKLACATGKLNEDVNAKNRSLVSTSNQLSAKRDVLSKIKVFEQSKEQALLENYNRLTRGTARLSALVPIAERKTLCESCKPKPEIKIINLKKLEDLSSLAKYRAESSKKVREPIHTIPLDKLTELYRLSELSKSGTKQVKAKINLVDTDKLQALNKLSDAKAKITAPVKPIIKPIPDSLLSKITKLEALLACSKTISGTALSELKSEFSELSENLKQQAKANNWHTCPQCGYILTEDGDCSC